MLEIEKLKNPFIKVVWEDAPENFTKEKMERVKSYFSTKYNTKSVKVVPKSIITSTDIKLSSLEATDKVVDLNYQKELIKDYLKANEIECEWKLIDRLDNKVNESLHDRNEGKVKHNRWVFKNVEYSNFLSFGEDNYIDYETMRGITVVESFPENFGGKTTATVDLFLFLFFGTTTKTKTMGEVFNRYSGKDKVWVKGTTLIDGETYIIERTLTRKKKTKGNDYTITNKLEFFKVLGDGTIENLNGEKRQETEEFITSAIGTEEDFLLTIMTTGYNLEELIDSKPTARGLILTKFLGLEIFKEKEDVAKEMYNTWSKKMVSNSFNITQLKEEIETSEQSIKFSENSIKNLTENSVLLEKTIEENVNKKEDYLRLVTNNVNLELIKTNPEQIQQEIETIENIIKDHENIIKHIAVVEPSEYYKEDEHEDLKSKINALISDGVVNKKDIENNENLIEQLIKSSSCPSCGQSLKDVDNTKEIENRKKEIEVLKEKNTTLKEEISELKKSEESFKVLKKEFDEYEKNKIIRTKNELIVEQKKLEISQKKLLLENYDTNKRNYDENKRLNNEISILKTKIDSDNALLRTNSSDIIKHKNNIENMFNKIKTNNELVEKIEKETITNNVFKIYLSVFGKNGISKVILKNMVPLINQELSVLLSDSAQFTLELNINDKNEVEFLMIDNETRVSKPLASGSGYEKTISSLALRCVITKISTLPKPNIMVMDEIFGKIADNNLELVGDFFKKVGKYFDNIILISHNPLIRNWSDNIMLIRKEKNISFIEKIVV